MKLAPFIYKETLHVIRDKRMLFVVIAIPIVQLLLFGFAISTEINSINVGVAYQDFDIDISRTIDRMQHNPYVRLKGQLPSSDIFTSLQAGTVDAVVMFGRDQDVQIITDASNPNIAQSSIVYLQSIISGDKYGELPVDTHLLYNPQLRSSFNFVPGIMGMLFLLVCALMTAVAIVREKETGTMEMLLVSPTRPIQIIISKMVPFFVLSCLDLAVIILIARYMLDVPLSGGILLVIVVSLVYILLSLAFGLFVSTIAKSQVVAMLICGMVMIMPVVMLSGMIFPVDNLPVVLSQISYIVPARWYIDAMRRLMIEGLDFAYVLSDFVILLAMLAVLMIVSLRNFKIRLS